MIYQTNTVIAKLLTQGIDPVFSADRPGFEQVLGACVDIKPRNKEFCTFYLWENFESRQVYNWDHIIQFYFAFLKSDFFYMTDAYWHHVLRRNNIKTNRIWPVTDLESLLPLAQPCVVLDKIKYHFTHLTNNRNDSRYCIHGYLLDHQLLHKTFWSWNNGSGYSCFFNNNKWLGLKEHEYRQFPQQRQGGSTVELEMDTENLWHHSVSAVTISTQSIFHGSGPNYDGKLFKCFLSMRPFILVGSYGTLADLRDQGFQTFQDIIDESYDLEPDPNRRMSMIQQEIQRLASLPIRDLIDLVESISDILQHNFQRCQQIYQSILSQDLDSLVLPESRYLLDYETHLSPSQIRC